jgi:DNA-binding transcriptional LysR family regulator
LNLLRSIEVFVRLAELGSFARVAERLSLSNASVTRHVAHLETVLGGRLFDRTSRKVRLTRAGHAALEHCRRVLLEFQDAEQAVREMTGEPRGALRVIATSLYWSHEISPRLPEFLHAYPGITLYVNLTEQNPDFFAQDYDLSLQFLLPADQTMIVRRIRTLHRVLCAAPDYLARVGMPSTLSELAQHNCLLYAKSDEMVEWRFRLDGEEVAISPRGNLRSTDALTLRNAAIAGVGIVRSPRYIVDDDIRDGRLVQLLPEMRSVDPDLYAVFPSRRLMPTRLRVFLDFLERNFAERS